MRPNPSAIKQVQCSLTLECFSCFTVGEENDMIKIKRNRSSFLYSSTGTSIGAHWCTMMQTFKLFNWLFNITFNTLQGLISDLSDLSDGAFYLILCHASSFVEMAMKFWRKRNLGLWLQLLLSKTKEILPWNKAKIHSICTKTSNFFLKKLLHVFRKKIKIKHDSEFVWNVFYSM